MTITTDNKTTYDFKVGSTFDIDLDRIIEESNGTKIIKVQREGYKEDLFLVKKTFLDRLPKTKTYQMFGGIYGRNLDGTYKVTLSGLRASTVMRSLHGPYAVLYVPKSHVDRTEATLENALAYEPIRVKVTTWKKGKNEETPVRPTYYPSGVLYGSVDSPQGF